jgi:hypothetical protein
MKDTPVPPDIEDDREVGRRAREIREDGMGVTQAEFVERLRARYGIEIETTALSKMENGRQSIPRAWIPCWAELGGDPARNAAWLAWGPDVAETVYRQMSGAPKRRGSDGPIPADTFKQVQRRDKPRKADGA